MAISIQPVDGLINRLLQQNSRPASVAQRQAAAQSSPGQDQVSISVRAQSQPATLADPAQPSGKPGEKALESHLLNLYKMNDSFGA